MTDLRREEFRVFDDGKEQSLAVFAVEGATTASAATTSLCACCEISA